MSGAWLAEEAYAGGGWVGRSQGAPRPEDGSPGCMAILFHGESCQHQLGKGKSPMKTREIMVDRPPRTGVSSFHAIGLGAARLEWEMSAQTLSRLREAFDGPIGAYANVGYVGSENATGDDPGRELRAFDIGDNTPDRYAASARSGSTWGPRSSGVAAPRPRTT